MQLDQLPAEIQTIIYDYKHEFEVLEREIEKHKRFMRFFALVYSQIQFFSNYLTLI